MEETRRPRGRPRKNGNGQAEKTETTTKAPADDQIEQYYLELCRSLPAEYGWSADLARTVASHCISTLQNMFPGERIGIPKRPKTDCEAIRSGFEGGKSVAALATEHRLTPRRIRQIIMR